MSGNIKIVEVEEKHFLPEQNARRIPSDVRQRILGAIANIVYGSVEVVVHDGKVVQIECREKIRVDRCQPDNGSHYPKPGTRVDG
jgi:hypothetical protein